MIGVAFIVDGFNLYHSLDDAQRKTGNGTKWLDLRRLLEEGLAGRMQDKHTPVGIRYFSAYATHRLAQDPTAVVRHKAFIATLKANGVSIHMGRFKACETRCKLCKQTYSRYEEKRSDVAIGVAVLEALLREDVQRVVVVSGDTDVIPAIQAGKKLAPEKEIGVAFPCGRKNIELMNEADFSWSFKTKAYVRCQLPDPFVDQHGNAISKPAGW